MLNIGSLVLGVCAWVFAGLAIWAPKACLSHRNTLVSFSLCAAALVLQLVEINRRVLLADYAAIADTIGGILTDSVVLVSVTVIVNLAAVAKAKGK